MYLTTVPEKGPVEIIQVEKDFGSRPNSEVSQIKIELCSDVIYCPFTTIFIFHFEIMRVFNFVLKAGVSCSL